MLTRYFIDYSMLSPEERDNLIGRIENVAYTFSYDSVNLFAMHFFLRREDDYRLLDIPDKCIVRKY